MNRLVLASGLVAFAYGTAVAAEVTAPVKALTELGSATAKGQDVGTVTFTDTAQGLRIQTDLKGLPPGRHGFHIHAKGSCEPGPDNSGKTIPAGAAGGHWDPQKTGRHEGPAGSGHLGDLPVLLVAGDGLAKETLIAPRIKDATRLHGLALIIHAGGDNYSDQPERLGGGGARIACGVIG